MRCGSPGRKPQPTGAFAISSVDIQNLQSNSRYRSTCRKRSLPTAWFLPRSTKGGGVHVIRPIDQIAGQAGSPRWRYHGPDQRHFDIIARQKERAHRNRKINLALWEHWDHFLGWVTGWTVCSGELQEEQGFSSGVAAPSETLYPIETLLCKNRHLYSRQQVNISTSKLIKWKFRDSTVMMLRQTGVEGLVDDVMCGDDLGSMPKPHPHNALTICKNLEVEPEVSNCRWLYQLFTGRHHGGRYHCWPRSRQIGRTWSSCRSVIRCGQEGTSRTPRWYIGRKHGNTVNAHFQLDHVGELVTLFGCQHSNL